MRPRASLFLSAIGMLASTPVWAHGEQAIMAPVAWGALGVGAVAGLFTGCKGRHPGVAFGVCISLLFAGFLTWAGFEGELAAGALLFLVIVPFAGAIPLAIALFAAYGATVFIKERFFPARDPSANEH